MRRGIVALLLVVQACGGASTTEETAPSEPSLVEERLTLEEPSPPHSPPGADDQDALRFAHFFLEQQLPYALRTGFTHGLGEYSLHRCRECNRLIREIDRRSEDGGFATLDEVDASWFRVVRGPLRHGRRVTYWEFSFRLTITGLALRGPDGAVVDERPRVTDRQRIVVLDTPGGWYVSGWESRAAWLARGGPPRSA